MQKNNKLSDAMAAIQPIISTLDLSLMPVFFDRIENELPQRLPKSIVTENTIAIMPISTASIAKRMNIPIAQNRMVKAISIMEVPLYPNNCLF